MTLFSVAALSFLLGVVLTLGLLAFVVLVP